MYKENNLGKYFPNAKGEEIVSSIVVVGSLNMDFVINVKKMPILGETILGEDVNLVPGGKGANQAYAVGKLGGKVEMIGAVGDDLYGKMLIENLQTVGVGTSGIEIIQGTPTGNAFISVDESGENSIIVVQGANNKLTTQMIDRHIALIEKADIIIMQLEIPLEVVEYVKVLAKEKGKLVILDPAPAQTNLQKQFLEGFDIVKPNETELQTLTGKNFLAREELISGAKELLEKGIQMVIVTLGGEGALLVTKDGEEYFKAQKVIPVDTTAAGDCFTAALALALSEGKGYGEAIRFGNCVSGIVVTRKGAQTSIPTMEEVIENEGGEESE